MSVVILDSGTPGITRVVCSFDACTGFEQSNILPFEVCAIHSIEWVVNSTMTVELKDSGNHLLYMAGNGRVENFSKAISSLGIECIGSDSDCKISLIVNVTKKY